ncbi:MAG: hypothetical protein K2J62_08985 [Bacteroidales bacterium]|nr:hypothetical protein [Bacteroidales bacterium]
MAGKTTKIVLDADVINHFVRGNRLSLLPKIFPEYQFIVLDVVKKELSLLILSALDRQISQGKDICEEVFGASSAEKKEYFRLTATGGLHLGKGESACMVYCRFHNDVVGSSNTKDVTQYCNDHGITYLTTNDFLFYAIRRELLTKEEAEEFIRKVRSMGSCPPVVDFDEYVCTKL